jgi:hypothetical protein
LTYNSSIFNLDTVVTTGTLTSGWTNFALDRSVSGKIRVVAVNASPLTGSGVLFYLRFYAKSYGNTYLNFDVANVIMNEGSPSTKLTNGTINISAKPKITVSPNSGLVTTGDKLQFYVSGGTSPFTWSVTNPSVATISSTGLLTATAKGFTKVVAQDNAGIKDTSDLSVEIRGFKLSFRDTSLFEAHTLLLPIYTTNIAGLDVKSGSVTVSFNSNYLTATGIVKAGTLLNPVSDIQFNSVLGSNELSFSFANATSISGSGILCYIQFEALSGGYSSINITDALFNESLLVNKQAANVQVKTLPVLNITPSISSLLVGKTQKFTASNGTAPYTWSVNDPTLASIGIDGTLTAIKSGLVKVLVTDVYGAKGTTGFINQVAAHLSLHDTTISKNVVHNIPVWLENYIVGNDFLSYQFDIEFDTTRVQFVGLEKAGTLSANWSVLGNRADNLYKIAGASTQSINTGGVLVYLQVKLKDIMTQNQSTLIKINNIILNEGLPLTTFRNGYLQNSTPTSTPFIKEELPVLVFPNPNNGEFVVENKVNDKLEVSVINTKGVIVSRFVIQNAGKYPVKLNIPQGEYLIYFTLKSKVLDIKKLLIVR